MKYSIGLKFLAILLCALMLLSTVAAAGGLIGLAGSGILSGKTVEEVRAEQNDGRFRYLAEEAVRQWASAEYGNMPRYVTEKEFQIAEQTFFGKSGFVSVVIKDEDDGLLYSDYDGSDAEKHTFYFGAVAYDEFLGWGNLSDECNDGSYRSFAESVGQFYSAREAYTDDVRVELYVTGELPEEMNWALLGGLARHQTGLIIMLAGSLLLFAIGAVYLCCSAGRKAGREEVKAGGLNALPLDLYFAAVFGEFAMTMIVLDEFDQVFLTMTWQNMVLCLGAAGFLTCLCFVGFCFACAAQFKMKGGYWFWNSITGRCIKLSLFLLKKTWQIASLLVPKVCSLCVLLIKDAWKIAMVLLHFGWNTVCRCMQFMMKYLRRALAWLDHFFSLLPLMWQWLGAGVLMILILLATLHGRGAQPIFGVLICFAIILYGADCFGKLMEAVKKMRLGELESKADGKLMIGSFRVFAEELNGLADVAMVAAQKQLKSERMKTELITNVSHDIKTPLTSIINYVDLLEKPHTEDEEKAYLEVLHRQSQRMKKLIEDLMEMSKASTGNIPVEIGEIDAVEAVNQALGEFSDKLIAAGLTPVFQPPEESVTLLADGRLLWRAMSNVLSNAVKYSLPGTRLYADVTSTEDKVVISFKNISGAQLNITADELMERFVRGDSSRNTEGSGLGLNIAKSLMELQKGQLQLLVDGDLFKVTLVFPKA